MASYNYMMSADEVAQELNCSKSYAYKLVKAMNKGTGCTGIYYDGWKNTKGVLGKDVWL